MILVRDIRLPLSAGEPQAFEKALHLARIPRSKAAHLGVARLSVDARHGQPKLVYTIAVTLKDEGEESAYAGASPCVAIRGKTDLSVQNGTQRLPHRPVVCGLGPAGLFAALLLARQGYKPIVLERGPALDERVKAVEHFSATGELDPNANIQFGEGGAGTFSDGKLTTRISDPRCDFVLEEMIRHGAPEEIRYRQKPHVGTDLLRGVVKSIREEIIRLGGQVLFETKMERVVLRQGRVQAVKSSAGEIPTQVLVLAIGHSARDTFEQLCADGVFLEPKPFSVGVRIEQRQSVIDAGLYGKQAGHPALPKGEYQLSWRDEQGRGVYTFCMCPGGYVVASSSEEETVVTNGMSEYARDGENANAALVVSVDASDFGSGVLDGVAFQRRLEHQAFVLGGKDYRAPAQSVKSYLEAAAPDLSQAATAPSFSCGVREADLHSLFPQPINQMLEQGLRRFNRRLPGFADADAVMTGVETRTSSPVRITRDAQSFQALGMQGLYPCGEGAGYAGGIMSAAVDGVRIAQQIIRQYAPLQQ